MHITVGWNRLPMHLPVLIEPADLIPLGTFLFSFSLHTFERFVILTPFIHEHLFKKKKSRTKTGAGIYLYVHMLYSWPYLWPLSKRPGVPRSRVESIQSLRIVEILVDIDLQFGVVLNQKHRRSPPHQWYVIGLYIISWLFINGLENCKNRKKNKNTKITTITTATTGNSRL